MNLVQEKDINGSDGHMNRLVKLQLETLSTSLTSTLLFNQLGVSAIPVCLEEREVEEDFSNSAEISKGGWLRLEICLRMCALGVNKILSL